MVNVYADCVITRRKRFHLIADETGQIIWRDRLWSRVIDWLLQNDISECILHSESGSFQMRLERLSEAKDT